MTRFLIYSPKEDSYIDVNNRGWTSGHLSCEVHNYSSYEEAKNVINTFNSLKDCLIIQLGISVTVNTSVS